MLKKEVRIIPRHLKNHIMTVEHGLKVMDQGYDREYCCLCGSGRRDTECSVGYYECPFCEFKVIDRSNFCPNCGVRFYNEELAEERYSERVLEVNVRFRMDMKSGEGKLETLERLDRLLKSASDVDHGHMKYKMTQSQLV